MTKFKLSIIVIGLIIFFNSCKNGNSNQPAETGEIEVLPEDIVELRDDQINLAGIQTGFVRKFPSCKAIAGTVPKAPK